MNSKLLIKRIIFFLFAIIWMGIIFGFSAQTSSVSSNLSGGIIESAAKVLNPDFKSMNEKERMDFIDSLQTIVRKSGHFIEYAILGFLIINAVNTFNIKKPFLILVSFASTALYAVTDEIHQLFVPGRGCRFLDVCIDSAGGLCGIGIFLLLIYLIKNYNKKRAV